MDLQKLVEQRDKLIADVTARLEARPAAGGPALPSVDVERAQAHRVEERIRSLEQRKAELVESIDAELQDLKVELDARTLKIAADSKNLEAAVSDEAPSPAPKAGKAAKATTRRLAAATPSKEKKKKKTRASSAKNAKPA